MTEHVLMRRLAAVHQSGTSRWDYRNQSYRYGLHGLFRYPAMMVPQMQGDILDAVLETVPSTQSVFDPFVGIGTTLVEAMVRDLSFTGCDVNPLAVLICEAKSRWLDAASYGRKVRHLMNRIARDRLETIDVEFRERDKWYSPSASAGLSRVRRAIRCEPDQWARRLMWVALAETARRVSNSRTSTYKMHLRPAAEIARLPDALSEFGRVITDSVQRVRYHEKELQNRGLLKKKSAARPVKLICGDSAKLPPDGRQRFDLLISSPPYGDNESTVPYGQFSYLPLRWIPQEDLPGTSHALVNAYRIDRASLGGIRQTSSDQTDLLHSISPTFARYHVRLRRLGRPDWEAKVLGFLADYYESLAVTTNRVRPSGYVVLTVGNRRVGGLLLPFNGISGEMLTHLNFDKVGEIRREIPAKLTPARNSEGKTMSGEHVLVFRANRTTRTSNVGRGKM